MASKQKDSQNRNTTSKLAKFLSGYSNKNSRAGYQSAIQSFLRCIYSMTKDAIKAGKIPAPDYDMLFEKYLLETRDNDADFTRFSQHLKETRPALSAKQSMTAVRTCLSFHGVNVSKATSQTIRRESMRGSAATVDRVLTQKIISAALQHTTIQGKALFLSLASSGARLNEMLSLRINDVDLESTPVKVTFRETKNGQQRFSYISDEAAQAVKEWMKVRAEYIAVSNARSISLIAHGKATPKNVTDPRLFPFSDAAVTKWWNDALTASGQMTRDDVTDRNQLRIHGFRKFFLSQMSLIISKEIPEMLCGHTGYLTGSYRRYDEETLAAEYLKAQHMVSITGTRQIKELENELKKAQQEQAQKTEKQSDALITLINEKQRMQTQIDEMSAQMTAIVAQQKKLMQILELHEIPESVTLKGIKPL